MRRRWARGSHAIDVKKRCVVEHPSRVQRMIGTCSDRRSVDTSRLLEWLQLDVLELDQHRGTLVHLKGEQTGHTAFVDLFVSDFHRDQVIDLMDQMISFGNDMARIPVTALYNRF